MVLEKFTQKHKPRLGKDGCSHWFQVTYHRKTTLEKKKITNHQSLKCNIQNSHVQEVSQELGSPGRSSAFFPKKKILRKNNSERIKKSSKDEFSLLSNYYLTTDSRQVAVHHALN